MLLLLIASGSETSTPSLPVWTLTVGAANLTPYTLSGASFTEIASSTDGSGLFTVNGAHSELVAGAPVTLEINGVTAWEGTVLSAVMQNDAEGNPIATMVRATPLSAQVNIGISGGSYQNNDVAVLAERVASATSLPWGGPATLGVAVGALSFTQGDEALTVLSSLANRTWRVQNGKIVFVSAQDGLHSVQSLQGVANTVSTIDLLGGADASTRVPLATQAIPVGSPSGPVCYVSQAEIADAGTLQMLAQTLADRYGSGAVSGSLDLPGTVLRAGDWLVDAGGTTAIAYQTRYELTAGLMQLSVQYGFPPLPQNPQYSAAFADAMHRTPVARLHSDYVVSGCDLTITNSIAVISAGTVNIGGTLYPLASGEVALKSQTNLVIATPAGFALSATPPAPGTGVALFEITLADNTALSQFDLRTYGGIGNSNLKPANPNNAPTISAGTITLASEGSTSAKATIPFTINGLTLDDTIGSIEVVQSFAGENQWGNPHMLVWSPGTTSFTDYRHGLSAGQGYDLAVNILGRDGKALNASPLLIGTSPTISASQIGIALNLDEVPDGPSGLRNAVSSVDSNHRALIDPTQTGHVGGALTDGSGAALHTRMSAAYQTNFDSSGILKTSAGIFPNITTAYSDMTMHVQCVGSGPYTLNIYANNGSSGDITIYEPSYSSTIGDQNFQPGHNGLPGPGQWTALSPFATISNITLPVTIYYLASYTKASGWNIQYRTTSAYAYADVQALLADGAIYAIASSIGATGKMVISGTGTFSYTPGGARQVNF